MPEESLFTSIVSGSQRLLDLGGPVVWVLFGISIVGLAIVFYKFIQFTTLNSAAIDSLSQGVDKWTKGDQDGAGKLFKQGPKELAEDVQFGLQNAGDVDQDILSDELGRRGGAFLNPYYRLLRPLELIYYLAPLLGLLGTVLGMIEAFRGLEAGVGSEGESTALAGGIWEALLTTAVGLSVAIPFAVMHTLLESRLERASQQISNLLTKVLTSPLMARGDG